MTGVALTSALTAIVMMQADYVAPVSNESIVPVVEQLLQNDCVALLGDATTFEQVAARHGLTRPNQSPPTDPMYGKFRDGVIIFDFDRAGGSCSVMVTSSISQAVVDRAKRIAQTAGFRALQSFVDNGKTVSIFALAPKDRRTASRPAKIMILDEPAARNVVIRRTKER